MPRANILVLVFLLLVSIHPVPLLHTGYDGKKHLTRSNPARLASATVCPLSTPECGQRADVASSPLPKGWLPSL